MCIRDSKWAAEGKFLTGKVARSGDDRLPPGQHLVRDWPILDLGTTPQVSELSFRLDITGAKYEDDRLNIVFDAVDRREIAEEELRPKRWENLKARFRGT